MFRNNCVNVCVIKAFFVKKTNLVLVFLDPPPPPPHCFYHKRKIFHLNAGHFSQFKSWSRSGNSWSRSDYSVICLTCCQELCPTSIFPVRSFFFSSPLPVCYCWSGRLTVLSTYLVHAGLFYCFHNPPNRSCVYLPFCTCVKTWPVGWVGGGGVKQRSSVYIVSSKDIKWHYIIFKWNGESELQCVIWWTIFSNMFALI